MLLGWGTPLQAQKECSCISDGIVPEEEYYRYGQSNFSNNIQREMRNIQGFFRISVKYILAMRYDRVCHEYTPQRNKNATVTVGKGLLNKHRDNLDVIAFVLAHEAAHTIQHIYRHRMRASLRNSHNDRKGYFTAGEKEFELQADYIAGYYMIHYYAKKVGKVEMSDDEAEQKFYVLLEEIGKMGDYSFESGGHHGRADERQNAFIAGVHLAQAQGGGTYPNLSHVYSQAYRAVKNITRGAHEIREVPDFSF